MTVRLDPAAVGKRLEQNPLITARDVKPSLPALEVVSIFNAATVCLVSCTERVPPDNPP